MKEFRITVRSLGQVKEFVALAMVQPFEVFVGNDRQQVNGKSFIGMFSLDYNRPVTVSAKCSDEEFGKFRTAATALFA